VLRACGAYEAFLRTRTGSLDATSVLTFLVLDRLFPRSLLHVVSSAEACLIELERDLGTRDLAEARRALGRCRTAMEFADRELVREGLLPHLVEVQRTCSVVNDQLAQRCFPQTLALAWSIEEHS
jgi:uncharacterized alpha-E superfamily protein